MFDACPMWRVDGEQLEMIRRWTLKSELENQIDLNQIDRNALRSKRIDGFRSIGLAENAVERRKRTAAVQSRLADDTRIQQTRTTFARFFRFERSIVQTVIQS